MSIWSARPTRTVGSAAKPCGPRTHAQSIRLVLSEHQLGLEARQSLVFGCLEAKIEGRGRARNHLSDESRRDGGEIVIRSFETVDHDIGIANGGRTRVDAEIGGADHPRRIVELGIED